MEAKLQTASPTNTHTLRRETMTKDLKAEEQRSGLSFSALFSWFRKTRFSDLVFEDCASHLGLLFKAIDHTKALQGGGIFLEIHHGAQSITDISIFNGKELLATLEIGLPRFAKTWPEYVEALALQEIFTSNIIVEFDYTENGYCFMGLFQQCARDTANTGAIAEAIEYYSHFCQKETGAPVSAITARENSSAIRNIIDQLGFPDYIGFIARGKSAIKLIIPLDSTNLPAARSFCLQHYSTLLLKGLKSAENFELLLEELLANSVTRISLDFDLEKGRISQRLGFECFAPQAVEATPLSTTKAQQSNISSPSSAEKYFLGCAESFNLRRVLPYGQKRPSENLVEEEFLTLEHVHRKFVLSSTSAEIKDYILLAGFSGVP